MPAGSCIRGYFFGRQETLIPAINQVLEQTVRMAVIFCIAGLFIPMGLTYACAAAAIGIVAEEIFSFLFVVGAFKAKKEKVVRRLASMTGSQSLVLITTMALPLTANRVVGSLLTTLENAMIPQRLQVYGMSASEAMSVYGQMSGMAMPLIFFPSAFLISLSISLVPAVSEASALGQTHRIHYTASKSLLFAAVTGFCAAAMFILFAGELGTVIYKQDLRQMLILLGIMCPFLYIQVVLSGILNGLGYQMLIFRNSLISSAINLAFIYFLTPLRGIEGFILGWFVSLIVVCFLELEQLRQSVDLQFEFANWFGKPLLCAAASGLVVKWLSRTWIFPTLGPVGGLLVSLGAMGCLYLIAVMGTGCLSISELKLTFKRG